MGTWGEKPYDSDTATEWFDHLFSKTNLVAEVEKGLDSDNIDEQRAAAFMIERLAVSVYVWPVDSFDRLIGKAIDVLIAILADAKWIDSWVSNDDIINDLFSSVRNLKERLVGV